MEKRDARRFTVRCRGCGRTMLSGIERVGDAEASQLRAHLAMCRPDLDASVSRDLGPLLGWFDVRNVEVPRDDAG